MKPKFAIRSFLLASSIVFTASPSLQATTLYWDSNGTGTAGAGPTPTGTWGTSNFWNPSSTGSGGTLSIPTANTDDLYFVAGPGAASGNSAYTVTVSTTQVANSLNFQASGATTISGGTSITLGNGTAGSGGINMAQFAYGAVAQGAVIISTPIILNNSQTWTNNSANTLSFGQSGNTINNNGNLLTLSGTGTFVTGNNGAAITVSGSGGLTVDGARLNETNSGGGGTTSVMSYTGTTTIQNGGTILVNTTAANGLGSGNLTLNGGILEDYYNGSMTRALGSGVGQMQLTGGVSGFSENGSAQNFTVNITGGAQWGTTFFNPTALLLCGPTASGGVTLTAAIDLNGAARTVQVTQNQGTLSGIISNTSGTAAGLIKTGGGTLVLGNGSNNFTGGITINAGALTMSSTGAWGGANKNVTFTGSAALTNNGAYTGGILSVANSAHTGSINVGANLTFASTTGAGTITGTNYGASSSTLNLGDASGFTGTIKNLDAYNGGIVAFSKLSDTGNLQLGGQSTDSNQRSTFLLTGAAASVTLNTSQIQLLDKTSNSANRYYKLQNDSATANIWVINTNLSNAVASRLVEFELGGTNTGNNEFHGVIGNGSNTLQLNKVDGGKWILSGANTYTGATTISAGALTVTNTKGLGNTSSLVFGSGGTAALTLKTASTLLKGDGTAFAAPITGPASTTGAFAINVDYSNAAGVAFTQDLSASSIQIGQSSSAALTVTGLNITSGTALLKLGNVTYGGLGSNVPGSITANNIAVTVGSISPISGTYTASGTETFTLAGNSTGNIVAGAIANITQGAFTATTALTKSGGGTWTLSGASTYTGATNVNAGNLTLGFGTVSANILPTGSALTLGGGTLQLTGTGTQTLNGLTTTASTNSTILLGANETLTLGALTSAGAGSWLNFNTAAGGANGSTVGTGIVVLTGQTPGTAINNGFTVTDVGGFGLATVNGSNQVIRQTTSTGATLLPASGAVSTIDYSVDNNAGGSAAAGSSSLIVTASEAAKSITVDTTTASGTLNLAASQTLSNNTWNFGGTGTNTYNITGSTTGAGVKSVASAGTITINNFNTGNITFTSPILANGANALVVNGTGTTVLAGANTFTGALTITGGGALQVASTGSLVASYGGAITIGSGSTFRFSSATAATPTGLISGAGGVTVDSGAQLTMWNGGQGGSGYTGPTLITGVNSRYIIGNVTGALPMSTAITVVGDSSGGGQFYDGVGTQTIPNNFTISGVGFADALVKAGAIRLQSGHTLSGLITLAGDARIGEIAANVTNTVSGRITGAFGIEFTAAHSANTSTSTFILSNIGTANDYTGNTSISSVDWNAARTGTKGVLKLGASEQIPNGVGKGNLVLNGADANHITVFELNGFNETINGLSNAAATGALIQNTTTGASTLTIGDNNTLASTFSGTIVDGGALKTLAITKIGTGSLTLSGTNTFIGGLIIKNGTLSATTSTSALGGSGSGAVTLGDTATGLGATLTGDGRTFANPITLASGATGTLTIGNSATGAIFSGGVSGSNGFTIANNTGTNTITFQTVALTNTGLITNTGTSTGSTTISSNITSSTASLTQNSSGSLVLSGNNTYDGVTNVTTGTIYIQSTNALGTTAGNTVVSSGAQVFMGTASLAVAEPFNIAGNGTASNGAIEFGGAVSGMSISGAITLSGAATIKTDGSVGSTLSGGIDTAGNILTLTADGGATSTVSTNGITGTGGSVVKVGSGTVVLSVANSYTGPTTISGGTLQLDGSTNAASTVGIGTAGILSGSGTVNGNATMTGGGIINKSSGTIGGTLGVTGGNWNGAGSVTGLVTSSSGTFTIGSGANLTANGDLNVIGGSIAAGNSSSTITGSVNYTSGTSSSFAGVLAGSVKTLTLNNSAATLTLTGTSANTFTGLTTVTAGTLELNKAGVNAIASNVSGGGNDKTTDILVNGGNLNWLASNQVADTASINVTSGSVNFGTASETIYDFNNSGGSVNYGTGTLTRLSLLVVFWDSDR